MIRDPETRKPLPDFDLASPQKFDPAIFGEQDIDGFVLSLALAFNDYKTVRLA